MSILGLLKGDGKSGFGYDSTTTDVTAGLDLAGRTILVTGCNSGLGQETLSALCGRGARVIGAARTLEKATAACGRVSGETFPVACDLSEPVSVRAAVASVNLMGYALDAIIANAGIMAPPTLQQKYGYELQFLTNHIGHHLLITGLLDQLADAGRVVMLSSSLHRRAPRDGIEFDNLSGEKGYAAWSAYGQSKLANLLFARCLATRLPKPGQTANAVHPGVVVTNLQRHLGASMRVAFSVIKPLLLKSIAQGAATQCYVAVHPAAASINGEYFADCNIAQSSKNAQERVLARKLWEKSEEIVAYLSTVRQESVGLRRPMIASGSTN